MTKKLENSEKEIKKPAITTATAVIEAFKVLKLKKVAVATPYIEDLDIKEKEFIEAHGFKVVNIKGLNIKSNLEIGKQPPHVAYILGREVNTPQADGIFISCTNFRTFEIISRLENDLEKPVITSNQASLWMALRELKIKDKIKGYGKLLEEY